MPPPFWTITTTGGTLNNVTAVSLNKGRRVLSDNYAAGYATIIGTNPSALPTLAIGQLVTCTLTNPNQPPQNTRTWTFKVADFRVVYGIRPSMDEWELILEDAFATLGRARVTQSWTTGRATYGGFTDIVQPLFISVAQVPATTYKEMSAQSLVNESALSAVQSIINTEQGLLYADGDLITFYSRGWQQYTAFFNFSDAGGAATKYQQLNFFSMADNLANKVVVTINGAPGATVGTGNYSYQLDSYALDATAAQDIGSYVSGALAVQTQAPNQMVVVLNDETTSRTLDCTLNNAGVNITLRGTTYQATVIGYTISSTPTATRVTLNLASTAFYNFLILNSTVYGTLDNNRLGF